MVVVQSVTLERIEKARESLRDLIRLSPATRSPELSTRAGRNVWLKLENLQVTGSFKERGAAIKLLSLSPEDRARGVVCASAGNHAQGVAYHATRLGIPATIVMPERTPLIKVQNTKSYGAKVVLHGAAFDEAYEEARRLEQAEGLVFVHPFDDDEVIAGQGTIGLEILEQVPDVDTIVIAVGGGGLVAGVSIAVKAKRPDVRIVGVEMAQLDSMRQALAHGGPVLLPPAETLSEGIAVRRVGERTYEAARTRIDEMVVVDDEETAEAILLLLEREKTVAEGAGAAAVAALLQNRIQTLGQNVVVIVCGGNIDVNLISRIIERGLVKSGRLVRLSVNVPDVFGALARLTTLLAEERANIVQIHHERAFMPTTPADNMGGKRGEASDKSSSMVTVELVLETRGFEHAGALRERLSAAGYVVR